LKNNKGIVLARISRLIGAIRAERCVDAEPLLADIAGELVASGYRLGGVLQADQARADRTKCDMRLRDLASGRIVTVSEDRGNLARGCRLDRAALLEASAWIAEAIENKVDLVLINKFGKAESEGGGMREVIALALERETPVLICANAEHHPRLMAFAGEYAEALPVDRQRIKSWALSVLEFADAMPL
jgi:nucleoside-triphosphatase THEP1